jgi:uncharacterized surface protein with fasciclin (FAS1) repeats
MTFRARGFWMASAFMLAVALIGTPAIAGENCPAAKGAKAEGQCAKDAAAASLAANQCPLKAAAEAKAAKAEGQCAAKGATNASLAKQEGECCEGAEAASLAVEKSGACAAGGGCEGKADAAKLALTNDQFRTFVLAVKAADMMGALECPKAKTVFAPTNEAFQKIPAERFAALLQDSEQLKAVLARHIVPQSFKSGDLKNVASAKASCGAELSLHTCPVSGETTVANAKILGGGIEVSNGVVYAIDSVLLPADQLASTEKPAEGLQVASAE